MAALLAPLAKKEAIGQDLDWQSASMQIASLASISLNITAHNNAADTVLLTVEALGRKVQFTTEQVMDILEGNRNAPVH